MRTTLLKTGRGFVQHHDGQYRDAIVNKGSRVIPMIVETLGGVAPHSLAYVGYLAKRAKGKTSKDGTRYGTSRTSTTSFFVHHTQRISVARSSNGTPLRSCAPSPLKSASRSRRRLQWGGRPKQASLPHIQMVGMGVTAPRSLMRRNA